MKSVLIGLCAVLVCGSAQAQGPSEFAAVDAKLKACNEKGVSDQEACLSFVQPIVDGRLNSVYRSWTDALKHPMPDEAKDDAEILKRLVAAERAWIEFRDKDCNLQSTSALGGTSESIVYGDCLYSMTKARVTQLEAYRSAR